jgi:acetyl-CoA synthetase
MTVFNMAAYCLAEGARVSPGKPALIVVSDVCASAPAELWSYGELEDAVLRVAGGLARSGLAHGDRLVIRLENTSSYAILFFGALAAGLVAVPASSQLTAVEVDFLVADSGARAMAVGDTLPKGRGEPRLRVLTVRDVERFMQEGTRATYAATGPESPALLIYTSGTTASPKGVLHAHRSALGRRPMYRGWYGLGPSDRMLHAGAFNWTYTLGTGLTDPWANGATAIVYTGERDPSVWPRLIKATEATLFAAVPGLYRQILKYGGDGLGDLASLRHGLVAGETPPPGLFEAWRTATGRELYEALGMSEISTYISSGPDVPRRAGAVGKPQPGRTVAILSTDGGEEPLPRGTEGLIAVDRSDPGLMLGYWDRPDEEASVYRGRWFVGGDLGVMDDDGYVSHRGRANDLMKALGYRVSPLEVEAALAAMPGIADVACAELRVRDDVSVIGAFIVPGQGASLDAEQVKAFARERLAAYKVPREVRFIETLPRTANGKVKRSALADA